MFLNRAAREGPLFFWRGIQNPENNCFQKQKIPNKLFADIKKHCLPEDAAGKNCLHRQRH